MIVMLLLGVVILSLLVGLLAGFTATLVVLQSEKKELSITRQTLEKLVDILEIYSDDISDSCREEVAVVLDEYCIETYHDQSSEVLLDSIREEV